MVITQVELSDDRQALDRWSVYFFFLAFFLAVFLAFFAVFFAAFFFFLAITFLLQVDHETMRSLFTLQSNTQVTHATVANVIMTNGDNNCYVIYRPSISNYFTKIFPGP